MCFPATSFAPFSAFAKTLYRMSFTNDDLPDPLTPVTAMKTPSGKFTVKFFRLLAFAPTTDRVLFGSMALLFLGVEMLFRPDR